MLSFEKKWFFPPISAHYYVTFKVYLHLCGSVPKSLTNTYNHFCFFVIIIPNLYSNWVEYTFVVLCFVKLFFYFLSFKIINEGAKTHSLISEKISRKYWDLRHCINKVACSWESNIYSSPNIKVTGSIYWYQ